MKNQHKYSFAFGLPIAVLGFFLLAFQADMTPPTIYLIGDSTMSPRKDPVEIDPGRGWGEALALYYDASVKVSNHAVSGRSTKSYISEGRWDEVLSSLLPGDYVFIQFGHNDQKEKDPKRYTNPTSGYYQNLSRFVKETRLKGGIPILLTSIVRRNFNEYGSLMDTHGLYPLIVREVARDLHVPLIDHLSLTEAVVIDMGVEKSKELYNWLEPGKYEKYAEGIEDNTHLSQKGAEVFAKLAAESLLEFDLPVNAFSRLGT